MIPSWFKSIPLSVRRLLLTGFGLMAGFGVLIYRLVDLQVVKHPVYARKAEQMTERVILIESRRGDILDVNGNPLATSIPVKRVLANPRFIGTYAPQVAQLLAPLIGYDPIELAKLIEPRVVRWTAKGEPITNAYVNLKRKVTYERWEEIKERLKNFSPGPPDERLSRPERIALRALRTAAIYCSDDQQRVYPVKELAAHVLGFVREQEEEFNNASVFTLHGLTGIEQTFNEKLTGVRGWVITETDRRQREVVTFRQQKVDPCPGLNVVLTLDVYIQDIVEKELDRLMKEFRPVSACAVVVRPRTGEILAMASRPTFDPNTMRYDTNDLRLLNRPIQSLIEPGSTFKIVTIAAALNEGVISLQDRFFCENGVWQFRGYPLRDHGHGYGDLSVLEIVAKSSNIGTAKIAIFRLGTDRLRHYLQAFGFGRKTGITLPGEQPGFFVDPSAYNGLAGSRIAIGQSIAVTPLQMTMAMSAIANRGVLMRPLLVKRMTDSEGRVFAENVRQPVRQVVSANPAVQTTQALQLVTAKGGTAEKAAMDYYTVAGKTGTAQKVVNKRYAPGKYVASFIGFFPATRPEVCIGVFVDEPDPRRGYYGGTVAAPAFRRIAEEIARYLKIQPDKFPTEGETLTTSAVAPMTFSVH